MATVDGTHIIEDHFTEAVLDPETSEPVGYGEECERVVTSFGRGFIPLIRYRAKDLVTKACTSTSSSLLRFELEAKRLQNRHSQRPMTE